MLKVMWEVYNLEREVAKTLRKTVSCDKVVALCFTEDLTWFRNEQSNTGKWQEVN